MRMGPIAFLVPAVVLSLGAALLVQHSLNQSRRGQDGETAVPRSERGILVARAALPMGHILKPEDLTWQPWPADSAGMPYVAQGSGKAEDFAGSVVRIPLVAGEPITHDRVAAPGERGFLASMLHPGMHAVSVAVTPVSGISGFVLPGDMVDILLTHNVQQFGADGQPLVLAAETERRVTETVLRGIRVLAVDQKLEGKPGEAVVAHAATLEVTDKQGEMLALAAEMGKLSLSLRSLASPPEPDSPGKELVIAASYTMDNQVSRFLRPLPPVHGRDGTDSHVVVLHGAKSEDPVLKGR